MKAYIDNPHRRPLAVPLFCAFLVLFLGVGASASDPDDDWGLPFESTDDSGDSEGAVGSTTANIRMDAEVTPQTQDPGTGLLVLDRTKHAGTTYVSVDEPSEAELVGTGSGPVALQQLDDGVAIQGSVLLSVAPAPNGSLRATLKVPEEFTALRGFLVADDLGPRALDDLLADTSGVPAGVIGFLPMGVVAEIDLNEFLFLIEKYADTPVASTTHVSIILLSRDAQGEQHTGAARTPLTGTGEMEIVAR